MQDEKQHILSLMADGGHRSFDAIQLLTLLEPERLRETLNALVNTSLLELSRAQGDERYVISLRGLIQ